MQIQVITTDQQGTPFDLLKEVTGRLEKNSHGYPIVYASAYAEAGLVEILEVRACRGERELLVMECNARQIQAVLEWQSAAEQDVDLEDLVLHLVRKAPTQANPG